MTRPLGIGLLVLLIAGTLIYAAAIPPKPAAKAPVKAPAAKKVEALTGWPQWMGPFRNWSSTEASGQWPPKKKWEVQVGESDSSPILVGGKVYVTVLEAGKTTVKCLDAETGRAVWSKQDLGGRYGRFHRGDEGNYFGPLSTPACDGTLLFTLSVDGDLSCWDAASGEKKWGFNLYERYQMGTRKHNRDYGYTSSPLLLGSTIAVEVGGNHGAVMAFRKSDGAEAGSWGSGQVGHSSGPSGPDGKVFFGLNFLWVNGTSIPWPTNFACNIATPAVSGNKVVCTSGYQIHKTAMFENGVQQWTSGRHDVVRSPVIYKDNVFIPGGNVACLNLATGKEKWNAPGAGCVIVTGDGKLITQGAALRLLDAETGKELSSLDGVPNGWPSAAFGEGKIICKSRSSVACYEVGKAPGKD